MTTTATSYDVAGSGDVAEDARLVVEVGTVTLGDRQFLPGGASCQEAAPQRPCLLRLNGRY